MKFTGEYVTEGLAELVEQFKEDYEAATIEVEIENGPGNTDILDLMEFMSDTSYKHACDKLVRQCIVGKTVAFSLDGAPLGSVRLNNLADSWSVFPVFNDFPPAYKALSDIITVHLLKKSKLPRKKGTGPGAVATVATGS